MELTFEMTLTVVVTNEQALLLAACGSVLGSYGMDPDVLVDVASSVPAHVTELLMPEQAAMHIPGIDIISTSCGPA